MEKSNLRDTVFCALDIETSGSYPLDSEICEIAAVKWQNHHIIDSYQTLVKPQKPMSDFIIGIHGISNEMVAQSPSIKEVIAPLYQFLQNTVCVAHHAPFDIGFLSIEMEQAGLLPIPNAILCTSLLSRELFPESTNHKLQTLVEFFKLEKNQAHRAYDDTISCIRVFEKCIEKVGWDKSLEDLLKIQSKPIIWQNFYLAEFQRNPAISTIIRAIQEGKDVRILYRNGKSHKDEHIKPLGLVRSPDGDYIFADSQEEKKVRRYYLSRIMESELINSAL